MVLKIRNDSVEYRVVSGCQTGRLAEFDCAFLGLHPVNRWMQIARYQHTIAAETLVFA